MEGEYYISFFVAWHGTFSKHGGNNKDLLTLAVQMCIHSFFFHAFKCALTLTFI